MTTLNYETRLAAQKRVPVFEKTCKMYGITGSGDYKVTVKRAYGTESVTFDGYIRKDRRITIPKELRDEFDWISENHLVEVSIELEDEEEIKWSKVSDTWWTADEAERDIFLVEALDDGEEEHVIRGSGERVELGVQYLLISKNCNFTDTLGTYDTREEAEKDIFNFLRHNRNP